MVQKVVFLVLVLGIVFYFTSLKPLITRRRRKRIAALPFPEKWREILNQNFPIYKKLPTVLKNKLEEQVAIFLDEKLFSGTKGLVIDDTMRVLIAAQACMLILNRKTRFYPKLTTIILYPSTFHSVQQMRSGDLMEEKTIYRIGESWLNGPLVLSWYATRKGARNPNDGRNVVFHEFAHQLDQEDNSSDGVPTLRDPTLYATWASVMGKEFKQLVKLAKAKKRSLLDSYGATNPAEFFAVTTEVFFERPKRLAMVHPDLYELFKSYYGLDPLEWED